MTSVSDRLQANPVSVTIDRKFTATSSHAFSYVVSYSHLNSSLAFTVLYI